jgi:hypothetical protein
MVKEELYKEIESYCGVNNIDDVEGFINKMLHDRFMVVKWGSIDGAKFPEVKVVEQKLITDKIEPIQPITVRKQEDVPETPTKDADSTIPHLKQNKKRDLYGE